MIISKINYSNLATTCYTRYQVSIIYIVFILLSIGVQKPGPQYSPAIYTMDIAHKIDIPLYMFDRIYYNI